MIKKILVNLLLIILVFAFIEYKSFLVTQTANTKFKLHADKLPDNNTSDFKTKYVILKDFNVSKKYKSYYKNTEKKPILWFGCSFAQGAGLNENDVPCKKISDLTLRTCLNKSSGATSTSFVYKQINDENFIKENPNADFVIYTFMWNHLHRLYNYQVNPLIYMFNIRYKYKNNKLQEIKPIFKPIYSSFFIKRLLNKKIHSEIKKEEKNFILFNALMKESAAKIKTMYPNAKFIIIEFPERTGKELPKKEIDILNSYGIEVFKAKDYMKNIDIQEDKYWLADEIHPSAELWNIILPKLKEKYSM